MRSRLCSFRPSSPRCGARRRPRRVPRPRLHAREAANEARTRDGCDGARLHGLFIGQAALVSTAEAHRPLERYLFYCTPLVFLASGSPTAALGLYIDVPETPLDGRVLGLKVRDLRYVTGNSTFDALHRRS